MGSLGHHIVVLSSYLFYQRVFLCCAARNGVYVNVVDKVREAFKTVEVVRLDCTHVGISDCKKIGVKLRVCSHALSSVCNCVCM
jgi:hypothetical protein